MKTFTTPSSKMCFSFYEVVNWVTPGQSTTSYLQLFGIFISMRRSCFTQI